jgi:hypothetical protein
MSGQCQSGSRFFDLALGSFWLSLRSWSAILQIEREIGFFLCRVTGVSSLNLGRCLMVAAFSFLNVCDAELQAQKCHKPAGNDDLVRCTIIRCYFIAWAGR